MDLSKINLITLLDLKEFKIEEKSNESSSSFSGKKANMINRLFWSDDFEIIKKEVKYHIR